MNILLQLDRARVEYILAVIAERPIKEGGATFNDVQGQYTRHLEAAARAQFAPPEVDEPEKLDGDEGEQADPRKPPEKLAAKKGDAKPPEPPKPNGRDTP
jgi:hypothetical protein